MLVKLLSLKCFVQELALTRKKSTNILALLAHSASGVRLLAVAGCCPPFHPGQQQRPTSVRSVTVVGETPDAPSCSSLAALVGAGEQVCCTFVGVILVDIFHVPVFD